MKPRLPSLLTLRLALAAGLAFLPLPAVAAPAPPPRFSDLDRDRARYRLENLFNELDLLIRNQKADLSDLKRQEREFEMLKVFERIPFAEDLPGLKRSLQDSAQVSGVELKSVRVTHDSKRSSALPSQIVSGGPKFRLQPGQLVGQVRFRVELEGDEAKIRSWIRDWRTQQMRLADPDGGTDSPKLTRKAAHRYELYGTAYYFRRIEYPHIVPRNPLELLPQWARANPRAFAKDEPQLWSYVSRIQEISPKAKPYYHTRELILLNGQRMAFFVSKATPANVSSDPKGRPQDDDRR